MGLGAAHHPACFTALLVPGWVEPSWRLGWGIGLEKGWAPLGASHPLWLTVLPSGLLSEAGLCVPGRGHPWDLVCVSNRVHFYFPSSPTLSTLYPLHPHAFVLVSPTHATLPWGMSHSLPSRPPPPWHRMARCLAHGGPRITPARWVPRSSKPASSAWVMILATTPRYLPPAWSTLRGGIRGEK